MKISLTDKHLQKFSQVSGTPIENLINLSAMGVLNELKCIEFLIRYDYKSMSKQYSVDHKLQALAYEYGYSEAHIKKIVTNSRTKTEYFCKGCGRKITGAIARRNNGLCDPCVVKSIKL